MRFNICILDECESSQSLKPKPKPEVRYGKVYAQAKDTPKLKPSLR